NGNTFALSLPLGKLTSARRHNERQVSYLRRFPAKIFVHQDMFRRAAKPFFTANNVCYIHQMIVHYISQMISRHAIRFQQYLIVKSFAFEGNEAADLILKTNSFAPRYFQADYIILSLFQL